jgi:hypothetical protein
MSTTNEGLIKRYLLGNMSHEERVRFEDEYFADADLFEEFISTENDLIDSFVRGKLLESEEQQFEQYYCVSHERREKVEFARALVHVVQRERRTNSANRIATWESFLTVFRGWDAKAKWATIATAGLMVSAMVALALLSYRLRDELHRERAGREQLHRNEDRMREQIAQLELRTQSDSENGQNGGVPRQPAPPDLTFNLTPGTERGSNVEGKDLVITPSPWIRLEMPLDRDEYKSYEAVLLTGELHEVRRGTALKSQLIGAGKCVIWRFSSDSVMTGDYVVELSGKTEDGGTAKLQVYSFRVMRRY